MQNKLGRSRCMSQVEGEILLRRLFWLRHRGTALHCLLWTLCTEAQTLIRLLSYFWHGKAIFCCNYIDSFILNTYIVFIFLPWELPRFRKQKHVQFYQYMHLQNRNTPLSLNSLITFFIPVYRIIVVQGVRICVGQVGISKYNTEALCDKTIK